MKYFQKRKIARLPHQIREEIHHRLRDHQPGEEIVSWLNSLPEAKTGLALACGGRPITQNNLSQWKKHAHPAWLLEQDALAEARRFITDSRQLAQAGQGGITDHLATFVAAHYALAVRRLGGAAGEKEHWKLLRVLCRGVGVLRRGDQSAERPRLQRQSQEIPRAFSPDQNHNL
jgi:hypothetical protein